MTIPMNDTLSNPSRERAQRLFNKNAELESKRRKAAQAKIPSDPNAWQRIRENYESILLEDHAFSEQHDIEYALWQLHYKRIEELRAHFTAAQNAKNPDRITKIRIQFKTFLSEATGFYHDLMVKVRAKYGLSLGYILEDLEKGGDKSIEVKKGLLSCHRSFIYLGDLARYKGLYGEGDSKAREFDAALSYYKQAATLWPSSGNPHHQLAILASYSGDELLAVYRYFRSLAIDTPFTTARDNLIIAFEKNRQSYCQLLEDSKPAPAKKLPARMNWKGRNRVETRAALKDRKTEPVNLVEKEPTVPESLKAFRIQFVRLNGILFTRTSLETFEDVFSVARTNFVQLLSSGQEEMFGFGSDFNECELFITRFIAILIFTVYNANKETENQSYAEILQRSVVLQCAFTAIFDFMALIVDRCLQLNNPSGSFLLPGIMIFVEWLACCEGGVLTNEIDEKQAASRSLFWNNFALFMNKMMLSSGSDESEDETCFFNMSRYDECETANRLALPEDIELRGFLPLVPAHLILSFSGTYHFESDGSKEMNARVQRIVSAGKALSTNLRVGQENFSFDSKCKRFFYGFEPHYANDVQNINITGQEINQEGEDEDEDEVIVFKPFMSEKHTDELSSKPLSSEGVIVNGSSSLMSHGGFPLEPPESSISGNTQYLQFAQPHMSKWMMGGEEFIEGLLNINLSENGFSTRPERDINSGIFKSGSFQDPATMIPSKFDSVMTPVSNNDCVSSKTKYHKSPVSRPVRHIGPPPGFNTAASKHAVENPALDDYSWLDGYQLPYSSYSDGFGNLPQPNKLLNTNKTPSEMECFPFPGKQVSTVSGDTGIGNGNRWFNYQIPERSSLYQEAFKMGNEQSIAAPQQYQGRSLWEGRFFV